MSPRTPALSTHSHQCAEGRGTRASHQHCFSCSVQLHSLLQHCGPCCGLCFSLSLSLLLVVLPTLPQRVLCHPHHCGLCTSPHQTDPLAICLHHMNPSELPFMWGSHSLFPKPSGSAVPPNHLLKAPQLCCCVCLGAWGTLLLLNPLESLTPSPWHPLTLTNPATLLQTYLKISFKKLLALTFK